MSYKHIDLSNHTYGHYVLTVGEELLMCGGAIEADGPDGPLSYAITSMEIRVTEVKSGDNSWTFSAFVFVSRI